MFSLVGVRDAFPHLNGVDQLSRLFKRPTENFTERGSSSNNVPQNIWAIPGHILVSLKDGKKLLVYDFLAKPSPFPDSLELLELGKAKEERETSAAVLSIFHIEGGALFLFIVLKDGVVLVMTFTNARVEWMYVTNLYLCKSKKTQIISVFYSRSTNEIFWCEKRSPTQCCVCKSSVRIISGIPTLDKTQAILHNCPPMLLNSIGFRGICIKPVANNPPNVIVLWLHESQRLQVYSFNSLNKEMTVVPSSSDYRNTMLETISLWVSNTSGIQVVSVCTHSDTEELLTLDSKHNVYLLSIDRLGVISRRVLCTLDDTNSEDTFRPVDFFSFKFFIGVILHNGEIRIYELRKGKLVWKSNLLKSSGPKRLYSRSTIPLLAFWNRTGLWILKSAPVVTQAEIMFKTLTEDAFSTNPESEDRRKISRDYTVQSVGVSNTNTESPGSENVYHVDKDLDNKQPYIDEQEFEGSFVKLKPTHSLSELISVGFSEITQFLFRWNSPDASNEFLFKLLHDSEQRDIVHHLPLESIDCVTDISLVFALFGDCEKFSDKIEKRLRNDICSEDVLTKPNIFENGKQVSKYMEDFLNVCAKQKSIIRGLELETCDVLDNESTTHVIWTEIWELLVEAPSDSYTLCSRLYAMLPRTFLVSVLYLTSVISRETAIEELTSEASEYPVVLPESHFAGNVGKKLWERILHPETELFELLCWGLWNNALKHLPSFTLKASEIANDIAAREYSLYSTKMDTYGRCLSALPRASKSLSKQETMVLANILLTSGQHDEANIIDLFVHRRCYEQAIDFLSTFEKNTEKYRSLFCKILMASIESRDIEICCDSLCSILPSSFTALDLCHVLQSSDLEGTSSTLFSAAGKGLNIGSVRLLLSKLLPEEHVT